jgi:hypothetical protein
VAASQRTSNGIQSPIKDLDCVAYELLNLNSQFQNFDIYRVRGFLQILEMSAPDYVKTELLCIIKCCCMSHKESCTMFLSLQLCVPIINALLIPMAYDFSLHTFFFCITMTILKNL